MSASKAWFRASREALGLTQQDVADAMDVRITTVKRWERPGFPEPPGDASAWLADCLRMQREIVDAGASAAAANCSSGGSATVAYYRTQEQYDELGGSPGPVGMANANARMVAQRLEHMGYDVRFEYPDDHGCEPCSDKDAR